MDAAIPSSKWSDADCQGEHKPGKDKQQKNVIGTSNHP